MKILMISNVFPPGFIGGYELGALDVARFLARAGHSVEVLTSNYFGNGIVSDGAISIDRCLNITGLSHQTSRHPEADRARALVDWGNIRRLAGAMTRFEPDLVIAFNIAALGPFGIVQFLHGARIPTLLYFMDNVFGGADLQSREYAEFKRVFGELNIGPFFQTVCMSRNVARQIEPYLGDVEKSSAYIPGWVDLAFAPPVQPKPAEQKLELVFCSRVTPHKGTLIMLDAAKELVKRGNTSFHIDVFGAGQVTEFMHEVRRRNLEPIVAYRGTVSKQEMIGRFADYDALVFPTWEREPYGFVVSEAAAAGCVPIMTRSIGASEWFIDGVDCIKIERSAAGVMDAIHNLVNMPPKQLLALRHAARHSAEIMLDADRWLSKIEQKCQTTAQLGTPSTKGREHALEASFLALTELWLDAIS